jgi:hypothetical protein
MSIATFEETAAEREARVLAQFTPRQRRWVLRRQHGLFRLLTTGATFDTRVGEFKAEAYGRDWDAAHEEHARREQAALAAQLAERAEQERLAEEIVAAERHYFATIGRVTTYTGPDYRVRHPGQTSRIRASKHLYDAALKVGMERWLGEDETAVPDVEALTA